MKSIMKDKRLLFFMLAFFFYIDGVHTVIKMSTSYRHRFGHRFERAGAGAAGNPVCGVSFRNRLWQPGETLWNQAHAESGRTCVLLYRAICGVLLEERGGILGSWQFALACSRAVSRLLSRSEYGKLIPKERANEYYGFFDIFGKYAAVMGTFLVSAFTQLTGSSSLGVLSIALLFIVGFLFLRAMPPMLGG